MRRAVFVACALLARTAGAQAPPPADLSASEARQNAEQTCAARRADCDWVGTFSSLERESILRVLAAKHFEPEPQPWDKVIDRVTIVNEEVFAEPNWLQFFNHFHVTTRDWRIRNELTIGVGEVWDQERIEESARRLQDPLYTSVVALLPVRSNQDGHVGLVVITRDVWSIRLNTQYTFQQGALTNLTFSLSENNFLGVRDVLSFVVAMDPGSIAIGPLFIDKDFLGQHLDLRVRGSHIVTRKVGKQFDPTAQMLFPIPGDPHGLQDGGTLHSEGADASISLERPLWSLASKLGGAAAFAWKDSIVRSYTGSHGDPYELFTDPGSGLPYEFRRRTWSLTASMTRQWGAALKHRLSAGYSLSSSQSSLLPSFAMFDRQATAVFAADVFPVSELISQPYVEYSLFEPRFRTLRNVATFDLAEDVQLGFSGTVKLGEGLRWLGGDRNFTRPSVLLGYVVPWSRDGFVSTSASATMRLQSGAAWKSIDNSAIAQIRAVTPSSRWLRVLGQVGVETRWHDTQNQFFALGSDTGLRGYNVNQFRTPRAPSSRRVSGLFELRSTPVPWWLLRVGAVAFYEVGGVGDSLRDIHLFNDVGIGLRALVPQTSRELFRFDLAFPLQSTPNNSALSPHFLAGFSSYF